MIAGILIVSVVLQFAAAVMAFRLIRLTGERWAWGLISAAILLMTVRRCIPLYHMAMHGSSYKADAAAEIIALAISVLMVIGIARIAPLFQSISQAKEEAQQAEQEMRALKDGLEQRVSQRTAQLEAANKELEAFAYSVSHDLRAPLRAIDGFSGILREDYADKLDDEGRRLLGVVGSNAKRMEQLIDDILKFSRTGRTELSLVRVDMDKLARGAVEELCANDACKRAQIDIGALPPALGDSSMLRQVIVNLLGNAVKFSRNKDEPRIEIEGESQGDEVVYHVRDNGVGFDMRQADKLFGVFQRLHGGEEFEGTGIGLAIVKRIVSRHGGRVWAEGHPNEGAVFHFSLPRAEAP